jgi:hypothetical protein
MRALVLLAVFTLTGCGGKWVMTTSSTGSDGKTTYTSSDPEEQERLDAQQQEKEDYAQAIAAAPRRSAADPIEVVVFDAGVSEELKGSLDAPKLSAMLVQQLSADPLLRVKHVGGLKGKMDSKLYRFEEYVAAARAKGHNPDVWVLPHAMMEGALGKSGGKLVAMNAFTLKSEVVSAWGTGREEPVSQGSILQNEKVVRDAGTEISTRVVKKLGPGLPSRPVVAKLDEERRAKSMKQFSDQTGIPLNPAGFEKLRKASQKSKDAQAKDDGYSDEY